MAMKREKGAKDNTQEMRDVHDNLKTWKSK